jgi:hypothetical protein
MRTWTLGKGDPLSLTLAADARFSSPDYSNDHIWEMNFGGGDPPALNLQTTFGLRARWLRLFPRFLRKEISLIHPDEFARPPALVSFYPNYLSVSFAPFPGVDVLAEYWAASSQAVSGRLTFTNASVLNEDFRFEWIALLSPLSSQGESMVAVPMGPGTILQGKTSEIFPVCVLSGNPGTGSGPYPGLAVDVSLPAGGSTQLTWALSACETTQSSYRRACQTLERDWESELTRIEMQNTGQQVEITTGKTDWDAALALSQKVAYQSFLPIRAEAEMNGSSPSAPPLPHASFVLSRQPDQGYSVRGDGTDYPYLWNGQPLLDAYYLTSLILPGGAQYARGLIENFLSTQQENGFVDWKPGLSGQRSRRLAQPLLATLACQVAPYLQDDSWLPSLYPALLKFVRCWFSPEHDRDQDGFPEWDHPLQTGLEDAPMYDPWHGGSQGVEITSLESPSLLAFLFNECRCLLKISEACGFSDDQEWLHQKLQQLAALLDSTWDSHNACYRYRDRETHQSGSGSVLMTIKGAGIFPARNAFKQGHRLLLNLYSQEEGTRPATVVLTGENEAGEIMEQITPGRFYWTGGRAHYTTQNLFLKLKKVEVSGVFEGDRLTVSTADYTLIDLSLFMPLWAGLPDSRRANAMVEKKLKAQFSTPFGYGIIPVKAAKEEYSGLNRVLLPWNHLIGEALLANGHRSEAAALVNSLMNTMMPSLKQNHAFAEGFHADNGRPFGERNSLRGLAPIGLFLQVIGIKFLSRDVIILDGLNPFPGPITVKYSGITITCRADGAEILFPTGQSVTIHGPGPHRVTLSSVPAPETQLQAVE